MISSLATLNRIYAILNIPGITSLLSGSIYVSKRPSTSNKQDIVISSLDNDAEDTQTVTVIIDVFCNDFPETGTRDNAFFASIFRAIDNALIAYSPVPDYLGMKKIGELIFNDNERKYTSILSIRMLVYITNNE